MKDYKIVPGDARISGYEMRLWSLHQQVLFKWGVFTMFTFSSYNVPQKIRGFVKWLVPLDTPHRDDIVSYVEQELADLQTEDHEMFDMVVPGTDVHVEVLIFSGIQPYVEQAELQQWAKQFVEDLLARFRREDEGEGETKQLPVEPS